VLQDWNSGRIPYYTTPPKRGNLEHEEAAIVATWAAEFDADKVFADEQSAVIAHLPSLADAKGVGYVEATSAGAVSMAVEEMEAEDTAGPGPGSAAAAAAAGNRSSRGDEDGMDEGDEYGAPGTSGRGKKGPQEVLYGEEGQFNPHAARAERKRQKKEKKLEASVVQAMMDDDDDDGFDFDEANEGAEGLQQVRSGRALSGLSCWEKGAFGEARGRVQGCCSRSRSKIMLGYCMG
jgi:nuclear GTP-binding protein